MALSHGQNTGGGWVYDASQDRLVPADQLGQGAAQAQADYSAPAYNYSQPSAPPPGVSGNQFDQTAINWQMAQKYGRERADQNRNLQQSYNQRYNDWLANAGSPVQRAQPNMPALFETDPNALYSYFNSSQPGLLLQGGRIADAGMGTMDPLEQMFALGQPGQPPAPRPGPAAPPPPALAPPALAPDTGLQDFGANLTPAQRVNGAQGPQPAGWLSEMMAAQYYSRQPQANPVMDGYRQMNPYARSGGGYGWRPPAPPPGANTPAAPADANAPAPYAAPAAAPPRTDMPSVRQPFSINRNQPYASRRGQGGVSPYASGGWNRRSY